MADTTTANLADAPWMAKSATLATAKASHTHHRRTGGTSRKTSRSGRGDLTSGQAIRTLGSSSA
jgi:hypothetical protein